MTAVVSIVKVVIGDVCILVMEGVLVLGFSREKKAEAPNGLSESVFKWLLSNGQAQIA